MSLNIISKYDNLIFSSMAEECIVESSTNAVVTATLTVDSTVIFTSKYYPTLKSAGVYSFCIYDISSLITNYLLSSDSVYGSFSLSFSQAAGTTVTCTIRAFYCSVHVSGDASNFLKTNFLTPLSCKTILYGETEELSLYSPDGETAEIKYYALYENKSGENKTITITDTSSIIAANQPNLTVINLSANIIYDKISDAEKSKIKAFTVYYGTRTFSYVVGYLDLIRTGFKFRNIFGGYEYAYLPAETVSKLQMDREIAVSRGNKSVYNLQNNKSFTTSVDDIDHETSSWLEWLLISPEIYRVNQNSGILDAIVISEGKSELSDNNTSLHSIEFTWSYTRNDIIFPRDLDVEEISRFSDQFNTQYY